MPYIYSGMSIVICPEQILLGRYQQANVQRQEAARQAQRLQAAQVDAQAIYSKGLRSGSRGLGLFEQADRVSAGLHVQLISAVFRQDV